MKHLESAEIERLRADIRRLELGTATSGDQHPVLATGADEVDGALRDGGLSRHAVHEVIALPSPLGFSLGLASAGAATGFVAGLAARTDGTVLWCRPGGEFYAPGLKSFGLDPARLLLAHPSSGDETLWAMEEALRSGAVSAVVGEVDAPTHTGYRRLQLAAERGGVPCFILRAGDPTRAAGPVETRWAVTAAPSTPDDADATWLGNPCFDVHLLRARGSSPQHWKMEWINDTEEHWQKYSPATAGFRVVPELGDHRIVADPGVQRRRCA